MRPMNRFRGPLLSTLLAQPFIGAPLLAAQWDNEAAISVGTIYTDNVCLTSEDEEDRWIATATPSGRVTGIGARAKMDLLFSLRFNSLANSSLDCPNGRQSANNISPISPAPRLRFTSLTELGQDWLYFDASAFADQNRVNAFAPGGGDELNGTGNTNTTYAYSLSPYINARLGQEHDFFLRYTYDEHRNTEDAVRDSTGNRVVLDVGRAPERNRWSYGIGANYYRVIYHEFRGREEVDTEISNAYLRMGYRLNRSWRFEGKVGRDRNDFLSTADEIDGDTWDAGVVWTPNERVTVDAGTGERFFGNTPRLSIDYRHKRSSLRFSYKKELTYTRNLRSTDPIGGGDVGAPNPGDTPGQAGTPTTLSAQPILQEGYSLIYSLDGQRTNVSLFGSYSKQTRAVDDRTSEFTRYGLQTRRSISRNLSLTGILSWADRETDRFFVDDDEEETGFARNSETWDLNLTLDRRLAAKTNLLISYRYRERESEIVQDGYTENRILVSIRHEL